MRVTYSEDCHLFQKDFLQVMPGASWDGHYFEYRPHVWITMEAHISWV